MKIAFLGDIAVFDSGLLSTDYRCHLSNLQEYLKQFDYVVANLEVPITNKEKTLVCKGMHLKSSPEIIDLLQFLHIDAVCLSNNHIYDFGRKGLEDTIQALESAEIDYYGIKGKVITIIHDNEKILLDGFCCYSTNGAHYSNTDDGVKGLTIDSAVKALLRSKEEGLFPVLSFHWGDEYSQLPNERQVALFYKLSEITPFLLHGHHAHVMQGIQERNGALAVYNMGNFCFDQCVDPVNPKLVINQNEDNKESFILSVKINNGELVEWTTQGIYYDNYHIELIDNSKKINDLSELIGKCNEPWYKEKAVEMIKRNRSTNLAKHDIKWLLSKINYYSIGAKILSYWNNYKYRKAF